MSEKGSGPSIFSLVGWVLGALSVLDLIEQLSPVEFVGKIQDWMAAYSEAVAQVGEFLFGWINIFWFSVSDIEVHVVILALIFSFSFGRAYQRVDDDFKGISGTFLVAIVSMLFFSFVFVPIVVLPGIAGLIGGCLGFALLLLMAFISGDVSEGPKSGPTPQMVLAELKGIALFVAIILVLNYTGWLDHLV